MPLTKFSQYRAGLGDLRAAGTTGSGVANELLDLLRRNADGVRNILVRSLQGADIPHGMDAVLSHLVTLIGSLKDTPDPFHRTVRDPLSDLVIKQGQGGDNSGQGLGNDT